MLRCQKLLAIHTFWRKIMPKSKTFWKNENITQAAVETNSTAKNRQENATYLVSGLTWLLGTFTTLTFGIPFGNKPHSNQGEVAGIFAGGETLAILAGFLAGVATYQLNKKFNSSLLNSEMKVQQFVMNKLEEFYRNNQQEKISADDQKHFFELGQNIANKHPNIFNTVTQDPNIQTLVQEITEALKPKSETISLIVNP